jgi:Leucine-rich repeat (LRR) protein
VDENAFRDLKILVELDLTKNNITKLRPKTFEGNDGLQSIKFSKNPIGVLQVRRRPE